MKCPVCGREMEEKEVRYMGGKFVSYHCKKCNESFQLIEESYLEDLWDAIKKRDKRLRKCLNECHEVIK